MRAGPVLTVRSGTRSPRFRRVLFVRDGVNDHGGAAPPRIAAVQVLPSTAITVSASTTSLLSRLNSPPHTMAVYASRRSSPSAPQHSLPGGRYPLPGPDFHRLERASFSWRTIAKAAGLGSVQAVGRRIGGVGVAHATGKCALVHKISSQPPWTPPAQGPVGCRAEPERSGRVGVAHATRICALVRNISQAWASDPLTWPIIQGLGNAP